MKKLPLTQYFILTTKYFVRDSLFSFASDCAFGFLFSSIPVIMMILTIAVRIFNASSEAVSYLTNFLSQFNEYFNAENFVQEMVGVHKITLFEIFLYFFIFWMARNFFNSLSRSLRSIFHTKQASHFYTYEIFKIAAEVLLTVLVAFTSVALFSLRSFFTSSIIGDFLSKNFGDFIESNSAIFQTLSGNFLYNVPFIILAFVVSFLYRFGSLTKPKYSLCLVSAFLCIFAFYFVRIATGFFINHGRYNFVYGVLGNLMITLLSVYIFFILFLYFAQFVFVVQFFDELLISELYLKDISIPSVEKLVSKQIKSVSLAEGETVFAEGENADSVYYIIEGNIHTENPIINLSKNLKAGEFFGIHGCMLGNSRIATATCISDTKLLKIKKELFKEITTKNTQVAAKVFSHLEHKDCEQ